MNAVGTNTAHSTSAVAMIGPVTSRIACRVASIGFEAACDVALDVLDDHDRIVDHDADGEHQTEERQRIQAEAEEMHDRKGADQRHRHGDQRNDRGAPGLQEHDDDQDDEQDGLEQRVHHRVNGAAHEHGRVVDDLVVDALAGSRASAPASSRARVSEIAIALLPGR